MKIWKVILYPVFGAISAGLVLCAAAVFWINTPHFRADLEHRATEALGRRVEIGRLNIVWGNPLRIEIGEFHLGNAEWGTEPDMAKFAGLSALVEKKPLLTGPVKIIKLRIEKPELFLERDKNGTGNWRFHDASKSIPTDPFTTEADDRAGFPAMLDAALSDGLFRMKTSGGNIIRIDAKAMALTSQGEDTPVMLRIDGAYNNTAARMTVEGGSYKTLNDPSIPYPAKVAITSAANRVAFEGTLTDPLNADGMKGALEMNAPDLGEMLGMFGLHVKATVPASLKSKLTRAGDNWHFEDMQGKIVEAGFTGDMKVVEGSRQIPDAISGSLKFDHLNGRRIIDGISRLKRPSRPSDIKRVPLLATSKPGVVVDARIEAGYIYYDQMRVDNVVLAIRNLPGLIEVSSFSFDAIGGKTSMEMKLDSTKYPSRFNLRVDIAKAEVGRILRLAKNRDAKRMLSGPVNARMILDMEGETVRDALAKSSRGGVVAYMNDGKIIRKLLQLATIDLHLLFGGSDDIEKMSCLLGVYSMHNGKGVISPLRLNAESAGLTGGGTLDLLNRKINVEMEPIDGTTGFLALDIPVRFSGLFSDIDIEPLVFTRPDISQAPAAQLIPSDLIPELRQLALGSNCTKFER